MSFAASLETVLSYVMIVLFVFVLLVSFAVIALFQEGASLPLLHKPTQKRQVPNSYRLSDYIFTVALFVGLLLLSFVLGRKRQ